MLNPCDSLTLLIVSDIHLQFQYLEKLKQWYININKQTVLRFDYVLVPGDTGVVKYSDPEAMTEGTQAGAEGEMVKVLKCLEVFNCPVLHIPGNHDAQCQFENKKLTQKSVGLHKQHYTLAEGLVLFGFGGSVPAYTSTGQQVWQGHPFPNQPCLQKQWSPLHPHQHHPDKQLFLMTHIGPHTSSTTIDRQHRLYYTGSKTFDGYLQEHHEKIVLWVHGHTHEGKGMCRVEGVKVVNPGPMQYGDFAVVALKKAKGVWGVAEVRFLDLKFG